MEHNKTSAAPPESLKQLCDQFRICAAEDASRRAERQEMERLLGARLLKPKTLEKLLEEKQSLQARLSMHSSIPPLSSKIEIPAWISNALIQDNIYDDDD